MIIPNLYCPICGDCSSRDYYRVKRTHRGIWHEVDPVKGCDHVKFLLVGHDGKLVRVVIRGWDKAVRNWNHTIYVMA